MNAAVKYDETIEQGVVHPRNRRMVHEMLALLRSLLKIHPGTTKGCAMMVLNLVMMIAMQKTGCEWVPEYHCQSGAGNYHDWTKMAMVLREIERV